MTTPPEGVPITPATTGPPATIADPAAPYEPHVTPPAPPASPPPAAPPAAPVAPAAQLPPLPLPAAPPKDPRRKSRVLAVLLSLFPGLGHVYLGNYQMAFVCVAIYVGLISILSSGAAGDLEPLFGISMAFLIFYAMIDAGRRASIYNMVLDGYPVGELPKDFLLQGNRGSIAGGLLLMFIGFLLFLHIRFDISMDWVIDWWPFLLVGLGFHLLRQGLRSRRQERQQTTDPR